MTNDIIFENNEPKRKIPIRRNSKFFGIEDYNLQVDFMKEYLEQHAIQTVILYQIDYEKTKVDNVYHEAKKEDIKFKTPIELPAVYDISDAELKAYGKDNSKGIYSKIGKLTFSVLTSTLEEYECDIRRGDYIGIQITPNHIEFFTVSDDGRVGSYSNKFTMYGTKPYARTIVCAPVSDISEFNG